MEPFDGSFSIELNSPIDEESWKVIEDAELDNTEYIYFTTPSGKRVDYIKANVLDKIRAEIAKSKTEHEMQIAEKDIKAKLLISDIYCDIVNILDKYKEESEEE